MSDIPVLLSTITIVAVTLTYFWVHSTRFRSALPLPPGPPKIPIVGNLFNAPSSGQLSEEYHMLSEKYGSDILHFNLLGTSVIVLDSIAAVVELFEKRGSLYSSRPRLTMISELMGWEPIVALLPVGPLWRVHRKMMHQFFNEHTIKKHRSELSRPIHSTLARLFVSPDKYREHLHLLVASVVLSSIYGLEVNSLEDPRIKNVERALHLVTNAMTPTDPYLVDVFPFLKHLPAWFPGAKFKRDARVWKEEGNTIRDHLMAAVKADAESRTLKPSMVSSVLEDIAKKGDNQADTHEDYLNIRTLGVISYAAGMDTTLSTALTFLLAMVLNPRVQRIAQKELDTVLGHGQLPSFGDQDSLPYVAAIFRETLRWNAPTPLALPHFIEVEDVYKGYRIPAESIVLANLRSILRNETDYPEADKFVPERFLREDGSLDPSVRDPIALVFGLGRRICPGRHHASSFLWLTFASILALYDISPAVDDNGKPVPPEVVFEPGVISFPKAFQCRLTPRSRSTNDILRNLVLREGV